MLRNMSLQFGRPLASVLLLNALPLCASFHPQDVSLAELDDPLIRSEVIELGGYQELVMEFTTPTLEAVPLYSHSPGHLEFRNDGLRVRIEAQPFAHANWVKRSKGAWTLEGSTVLGWSPAETHTRLGRVEVIAEGRVVQLPTKTWVDIFDAPMRREELMFAAVMRSRDGLRTYLHLQAGDAADARMVTWVIANGSFLFRVVDHLP